MAENTTLKELKEALAKSEKEKASLLKVVAHDIRSPLNKLFALIGLFKMSAESLSSEQQDYLDKMELVIGDGLSKMRNLMDLRLVVDKTIKTNYGLVDLSKLIKKSLAAFQSDIVRKNITINFNPEILSLETDSFICLRIIDQLISNAIKYSPAGSSVSIIIYEQEDAISIHVVDGGYGISREEQKMLFKKFAVLSTRATGGESSTGIGLYIAQKMAEHIGGKISYKNNEQSTFTLCILKSQLA